MNDLHLDILFFHTSTGVPGNLDYQFTLRERSTWQHDNLSLSFDPAEPVAKLSYTVREKEQISYLIGLDNIFRVSDCDEDTYAAKGRWTAPTTFTFDYEQVGYSNRGRWIFTFKDDVIDITEVGVTGEQRYQGKRITGTV